MDAYEKKPEVTKYGYDYKKYDTPLNSRVGGKSASQFREEPVVVDGGNFNKLLIQENKRLQEENKYLEGLIDELMKQIKDLDDLD